MSDGVVVKFILNNIHTISGDPDYESLNKIIQALYSNVATLPTMLAGGKHGHIGLIMKDTLYTTLMTGTPWEDLDDTGSISTIATNFTDAHHQQANVLVPDETVHLSHNLNPLPRCERCRRQVPAGRPNTRNYASENCNKG